MQEFMELSHTEIVLSFAATCVEGVARRLDISYYEAYSRMKKVDLIEKYIIEYYDVLHLESRTHVIDNVIECLNNWEAADGTERAE
jgi:hypothetical protein